MKKIISLGILLFIFSVQNSYAQVKKYGKVSADEFNIKADDSEANAMVLFKKEIVHTEYDGQKWSIITEVHERIKLFNKDGFENATKKIRFYSGNNEKENLNIKATTYNLEGKKVVKTKLKKKDIFENKENKYWSSKKFTLPNLKEGSIVEWKYKITSSLWRIEDVVFQYDIPIKYFEAKVKIPEYFIFKANPSKYYITKIVKSKENRKVKYSYAAKESIYQSINTKHSGSVDFKDIVYNITLKNVKALIDEPYVNNIENYRGKVKFELVGTKFPNSMYKNFAYTWEDVTESIFKLDNFGGELKKSNYFKKDLEQILSKTTSNTDKIIQIFNFVKNKVKWDEYYGFTTNKGVRKAYKEGTGNIAEINFILIAMLREAGLDVSPILISTRSHGVPLFPTRKGFNYVIAGVELDNEIVLLDASEPYSTPNVLPIRALNWQGRIIRKYGSSAFVELFPKVYSNDANKLVVKLDNQGNISGSLRSSYNNLYALNNRKKYGKLSKESLIENLEDKYKPIEIEKVRINNVEKLDKVLTISLQYKAEAQAEIIDNKMYFAPLFFLRDSENVFKSETRNFPIDFGSAWQDIYKIVIQIPDGYKVEKLPENFEFNSENNVGNFTYKSTVKGNNILLTVTKKINSPIIPYNFYKELKEFFSKMILKQKEKVVLVKQ